MKTIKALTIFLLVVFILIFLSNFAITQENDNQKKIIDFNKSKFIKDENKKPIFITIENSESEEIKVDKELKEDNAEATTSLIDGTQEEETEQNITDKFLKNLNVILIILVSVVIVIFIITKIVSYFKKRKI